MWEGAEALSAFLRRAPERCRGKRVLELGAGAGECGLVAACLGAHACLTDVRAVVEHVIRRNVEENGEGEATAREAWPGSIRVGRGSATRAVGLFFSTPEASFALSTAARTSRAATDGGKGGRVFMPYKIASCCTMDASTSAFAPRPRSAPGSNDAASAGSVSACLRSQKVATPEG